MKPIISCTVAAGAVLALASVAIADDNKAFNTGYGLGKDVARLEREVAELRGLLQQLLELDKQRVTLLERALAGQPIAPATRAPAPALSSRKAKRPKKAGGRGAIAGRVTLPGRDRAAFVYVENVKGRMLRGKTVKVAQRGKKFVPELAVVQKGTTVSFPNEDTTYHNVFAKDPTATFDLGIYRAGDAAKSYRFTAPGDVDIYCNMHAGMRTRVVVVPNHLYAKVGSDGSFKLAGVPSGRRKIVAVSTNGEPASAWIDVGGGETARVNLSIGARKTRQHTNKHGQPYGSYE